MKNRLGALVGLVIGLSGCAVGPDYRPPDISVPNAFVPPPVQIAQKTAQKPAADLVEWWRFLRDPELTLLVSRAIESNLDLEIALTRLQEARTQEFVVTGEALPAAGGTGGAGLGTGANLTIGRASPLLRSAQNPTNLSRLSESGGFDAAWEVDIFGKFWRELEAATYDSEALAEARNWIVVTSPRMSRAYLDMRALQRELAVLRGNIKVAKDRFDYAKTRYARGITNELDVALCNHMRPKLGAQNDHLG